MWKIVHVENLCTVFWNKEEFLRQNALQEEKRNKGVFLEEVFLLIWAIGKSVTMLL